jgi:hypothetical protein
MAVREEGDGLTAPDPTEDSPPVPAWRPSARRRLTVLVLALVAAALAIVVVITGPPGPVTYDMRLPLLVLAGGALANAVQWRRQVRITADEVVLRTLVAVRRVPLAAVARVETDEGRVTIRTLSGRKAVVRGMTGLAAADDLASAVVSAAGPTAHRAAAAPSAPVPVVTPWLLTLLTIGTALLAAEGYAAHPTLVVATLGTVTAATAGALGGSWFWQRRRRETSSEPGG